MNWDSSSLLMPANMARWISTFNLSAAVDIPILLKAIHLSIHILVH
jgi:hypothetical protein